MAGAAGFQPFIGVGKRWEQPRRTAPWQAQMDVQTVVVRRLPEGLTRARQARYGRNRNRTTYCTPSSSLVTPVTVPLPNTGKGSRSMGAGEATRPT